MRMSLAHSKLREAPQEEKALRSRKKASVAEGHEVSEGAIRRLKKNHVWKAPWSGKDLDTLP